MFTMRFDMRAPGRDAEQRAALYTAAIEMAAWAHDKGCATISISEHHADEDGYLPSPLMLAASIAAVTTTTPIAIAAGLLAFYDPIRLAEDMIVLDHISRGRVSFTLALGYRPVEYELQGLDYQRRAAIVDEKLGTLLEVLGAASEGTTMPRVTPPPFTTGGPMVTWGGGSKAAARRAGRHGLGFVAQGAPPGLQEAYEQAARASGHQPGICFLPSDVGPTSTFVNDDIEQGWREVGPALLSDAVRYGQWNEAAGAPASTVSVSSARTLGELRAEKAFHRVVTVAEAVEIIERHGSLSLQPLCSGLDPEIAWRYLRRVVDQVLPAVPAS